MPRFFSAAAVDLTPSGILGEATSIGRLFLILILMDREGMELQFHGRRY